jgi:hypothetical protein
MTDSQHNEYAGDKVTFRAEVGVRLKKTKKYYDSITKLHEDAPKVNVDLEQRRLIKLFSVISWFIRTPTAKT